MCAVSSQQVARKRASYNLNGYGLGGLSWGLPAVSQIPSLSNVPCPALLRIGECGDPAPHFSPAAKNGLPAVAHIIAAGNALLREAYGGQFSPGAKTGGLYWARTSDLFHVKEAL